MSRLNLILWLASAVAPTLGVGLASHPLADQLLPGLPSVPGLDQLLANPGKWLTDMFNAAVVAIGKDTSSQIADFLNSLGAANIISRTPAELSYANPGVVDLSNAMRQAALVALAAITAWGGINLIVHPHIRAPYHGALELVPRVLLGGILVWFSRSWGGFVIELNNALCQTIGGSMPGWDTLLQQQPSAEPVLLNLVALVVYLIMGMLLVGQMLMRLALVDALLVVAPLALLCWVLPQTYAWARLWFTTFFGTVFVQAIQVLVLRLGADLMQSLVPMLGPVQSNPLSGAHAWLMTLLLGMAVLQLARKIPRLVQGVPAGMGDAYRGPTVGQLMSLFHARRDDAKGRK